MSNHCVIMAQPLYGYIPPTADGQQKLFLGMNVAQGYIKGYLPHMMAYVDEARNQLVKSCEADYPMATHMLWVDQDMKIPFATVKQLLEDDKDFVSAVYFGKDEKADIVGWESLHPPVKLEDFVDDGLQQVGGMGLGCALVKMEVFRRMREKYGDEQWFWARQSESSPGTRRAGEDYHFCSRLEEMGIERWLDGRVRCSHLGELSINYNTWRAIRGLAPVPLSL